ncbi:hypothetical protein CPC16_003599 [Podila verticillata]|nr:hypothetical protein BGZ52_008631 [Haplosporangium bisporale]KAF9217913.1 hypothetical protein BGZ59_008041 [Podila verticillata]KAF9396254.1 hypothetical protein CPC16_003599 [Podila verticillata]KFH67163.1 hypothetical protein MVEG_07686 [Podila verticillata NRRL 6337]
MLILSAGRAVVTLGAIAFTTTLCSASVIPLHQPLASTLTSSQHDSNADLLSRRFVAPYRRYVHFFDNGYETSGQAYEEEENPKPPTEVYKDDQQANDIEIYKTKQPNTPPSSQPSDPFALYNYQSVLPTDFKGTTARRTIVVGDIHGSLAGFEGFLTQIGYDGSKDQLILAGDLVAKGPESLQVVDKARALNALCVRGNHDDKVIRWRGYLDSLSPVQLTALDLDSKSRPEVDNIDLLPEYDPERPELKPLAQMRSIPADLVQNSEHHRIAKAMTPEQYQYLVGCPLMLQLPKELSVRKVPVYVVHAGIDPKVELMHQQPWVLTNVRNLLDDGTPYRKKKKGQGWAKVFNSGGSKDFMLVYGHDAGRSVNVKEWSVGLDSGCVYGRSLSGYVVETGEVYSVPCPSLANLDEDFE